MLGKNNQSQEAFGKGFSSLYSANIILLDSKDNSINDSLLNAIIDNEVGAFWDKLNLHPHILNQIITNANYINNLAECFCLYVELLQSEAERISGNFKIEYQDLPEKNKRNNCIIFIPTKESQTTPFS